MAWSSDETKMDTGQLYMVIDTEDGHKYVPVTKCKVEIKTNNDALYKYMLDSLQLQEENLKAKEYLFGTPKYVLAGDYIPFEWLNGNPNLGLVKPYCKIELFNEKENKTMDRKPEARKCERCGKLFEVSFDDGYCDVTNATEIINKTIKLPPWSKDQYNENGLNRQRTERIRIHNDNSEDKKESTVPLCRECRTSLKQWWENPDKILVDAHPCEEAESNG